MNQESKFVINNFESLLEETQRDLQDQVAGHTPNFQVITFTHCDACGRKRDLIRLETLGGIIRVCGRCLNGKKN